MISFDDLYQQISAYLGNYRGQPDEAVIAFLDEVAEHVAGKDVPLDLLTILKADSWGSIDSLVECYNLSVPEHTLLCRISRGGFGVIYKAVNDRGKLRAIKIEDRKNAGKIEDAYYLFHTDGLSENEELPDAFRHENIVKHYGRWTLSDGRVYHVLEWIDGITLEKKSKVSVAEFEQYFPQIFAAVQHIHQSHSHNDLRRANIMVDDRGLVTLLDFGIATQLNEEGISSVQLNISSRRIAAPESIARGELSKRTDVRALGQLFYEMLTDEHPFPHSDPDELEKIVTRPENYVLLRRRIQTNVAIPDKYKPIIWKCLAYDPNDRYQSVDELTQAIQPKKRKRILPWISGAVVAAGLACAGVSLVLGGLVYYKNSNPEVIVEQVPAEYEPFVTEDRKVPRSYRIADPEKNRWQCKQRKGQGKMHCFAFFEAEQLLDQGEFVQAGIILEGIVAEDPDYTSGHEALIEAYFELGLFDAAQAKMDYLKTRTDLSNGISDEELSYGDWMPLALARFPETDFSHPEVCDLRVVKKQFSECSLLVKASDADDYQSILKKYPKSFIAHGKLARMFFKTGGLRQHDDGSIKYGYIDSINEALEHYGAVAKLRGVRGGVFYEIGRQFVTVYNDRRRGDVFFARAALEGYIPEYENFFRGEKVKYSLSSAYDYVRCVKDSNTCSESMLSKVKRIEQLSKQCTTGNFSIQQCTF